MHGETLKKKGLKYLSVWLLHSDVSLVTPIQCDVLSTLFHEICVKLNKKFELSCGRYGAHTFLISWLYKSWNLVVSFSFNFWRDGSFKNFVNILFVSRDDSSLYPHLLLNFPHTGDGICETHLYNLRTLYLLQSVLVLYSCGTFWQIFACCLMWFLPCIVVNMWK